MSMDSLFLIVQNWELHALHLDRHNSRPRFRSFCDDVKHLGSGVFGRKQGRYPFLSNTAPHTEGRLHQGIQGIRGGERSFGLCDHAIFPRGFVVHHLRGLYERTVSESCGGIRDEILPSHPQILQGNDRRRLRNRRFEIMRDPRAFSSARIGLRDNDTERPGHRCWQGRASLHEHTGVGRLTQIPEVLCSPKS